MVYSNEPIRYYKNRRGKPDPIIRWLELSSIIVWIIYMFSIVAILAAKPVEEGLFDRFFDVPVRGYWDMQLLGRSIIICMIQFVISVVSIILNTRRMKRRYDIRYISHYISAPVSLLTAIIVGIMLLSWSR
ncbi:MAG: hypothetical protein GXX04_06630 [Clostridiaceae bacterium]|nr:hypothetical protein [Clostridiaceae bacterium]